MRVNKYVLDANVWISYIITQTEYKLTDSVVNGKVVIFICDELIAELERVFNYPQLSIYRVNIPAAITFVRAISVNYHLTYPIKRYIANDADDDYIIALAYKLIQDLLQAEINISSLRKLDWKLNLKSFKF